MRVSTIIDGVDLSHRVLRGEGVKINVNVEEEDGTQKVTASTASLSNLHGHTDFLLGRTDSAAVQVLADNVGIFSGAVSPVDTEYDSDQRILNMKFVGAEASLIARMKEIKLNDNFGMQIVFVRKQINSALNPNRNPIERWFCLVNDLLLSIARVMNLQFTPPPWLNNIWVGGLPTSIALESPEKRVPDWSFHRFITSVTGSYNCLWRIVDNTLQIVPKHELLTTTTSIPLFPSVRDSIVIKERAVGYDLITFSWASGKGSATIFRAGPLLTTKQLSSEFGQAAPEGFFPTGNYALIAEDSEDTNILIDSWGATPEHSHPIFTEPHLNTFWRIELFGTNRVSGDYLVKNATPAQLKDMCNAFYTRFGDQFITGLELNWQERTASITGVKYAIGG